ncbi:hypothetical protein [Breznakiella homolactica]|uniref:Uncharacterized protein n=1 Tax=Breznakiella homolactica TaxID=2798577 RepID=A0A7T7XPH2_9SPIR|nr:hypothetical protein [Breznakiella homolactica]QQO09988.1 hypothetical protein JFL75_03480 [Breznakiella homolactica]
MKIDRKDNIKDIAPTLIEQFTDMTADPSVCDEYNKKKDILRNRMGTANKYFFGHLHDSEILSQRRTKNDVIIYLNDYAALHFALALIKKKDIKINQNRLKFPVVIRAMGVKHFSVNKVNPSSGHIKKCKTFTSIGANYLYKEIIEWESNAVEIAFNYFKTKSYPDCNFLVLLSCEKILIKEKQETYWNKYFTGNYYKYYQYFLSERNKLRFLSDYGLCEELLNEIDESQRM